MAAGQTMAAGPIRAAVIVPATGKHPDDPFHYNKQIELSPALFVCLN
jgi:hypothetical protein